MKKIRTAGLIVIGLIILIGIFYFVVGSLEPKVAGIYIETNPSSTVYLNNVQMGTTPYRVTTKPGETIIRLIPDSYGAIILNPYETKVNLIAGVETVLRYDFGGTDDTSTGDIISFEKNQRGETNLVAVSIPDSVQLVIDGTQRAFTPHKTSSILPGEHQLRFAAQGYQDRVVKVKITKGYKLTAIVKLAKAPVAPTPTPTPGLQAKDQVEILSTGTGFLRVRSKPSTLGDEVGRVSPGERYALVATDSQTGWYKIELEQGSTGWISNQYARKIGVDSSVPADESSSASATVSTVN
jgi:hypothetical protein